MRQARSGKPTVQPSVFRNPNGMRLGVHALCPIFADEKREADRTKRGIIENSISYRSKIRPEIQKG